MAIIYTYPTVTPTADDLILGTDVNQADKPTKNFTIQSIVDIVSGGAAGLGAVLAISNDAADPTTGTNQSAINFSNVQGTGTFTAGTFTDGTISITGGVGTGFTAFTSTAITGTLQTAAQPNITSLGALTALVVNGAVSGTGVITSTTLVGASNTNIVSTLAIKTYVDSNPPGAESLAATLLVGNTTGGTDIAVSAADDITLTDTSKVILGTGGDTEITHNGTNFTIANTDGDLELTNSAAAGSIKLTTAAAATKVELDGVAGVELDFNNSLKFETLAGGAKVTGALEATGSGTFVNILNTGTYQDTSGDVGAAGQLLSSTGTGTNWVTEAPLYTWIVETDSGTGSPYTVASGDTIDFVGVGNISTAWDNTTKEVRISSSNPGGSGTQYQVTYWDPTNTLTGAAGFTFAGGATGKVTVAGELEAATLSDGTFSGTAGTYTGGVSITSALFVGPLTGNATTATSLASAGTIGFGGDVTLSSAAPSATYTSGGSITFNLGLVNSAVTGQVLTGLPTPAAASITAADTILSAFGKTQSQINSIANGLQFQGTWNATTNSPTLASGGGEATSGTTTSTTADKLVDSGANFTATVTVGDKVVNQVDGQTALVSNIDSATVLALDADIMLTGEAYTIDNSPFITQGHYYVVSVAGSTSLNGISDWVIGDWVIAGATNVWEKLDGTAVQGTGTDNYLTKWNGTGVSIIVDSGVSDDGSTIKLLNDVELGASASDTTLVKGPTTFDENVRFDKSISIGAAYGSAGQVFTSGGGAGAANTWTNISSWGYVESVTASTGITIGGTAVDPTVAIDYVGADNAILAASAATPVAADTIWFSDADDSTIKKALISALPLDNYVSWTLAGDSGSSQTISSGNTATIAGGTGIITDAAATDTVNVNVDYVGADNIILSAGAGTPVATDELWFNNADVASGTVQRATIADILDLGNETLAQVLGNGDTTGGTDIAVSAGDDITFTDTSKILMGASNDLEIFHDSSHSYIKDTGTGDLTICGSTIVLNNAADNANMITATEGSLVRLFHNGSAKLVTTATGVEVTGSTTTSNVLIVNGANTRNLSTNGSGYLTVSNAANSAAVAVWTDGSLTLGSTSGTGLYDLYANNGTFANNVQIDGNLTVDGQIIHGGSSGTGGGTFTGTKGVTAVSSIAFTLKRAVTGTLVFDVYMQLENALTGSVAKKYTVAHSHNTTPVYNKIIDTGPDTSNDFSVVFSDATGDVAGDSVTCNVTSTLSADLSYTVMVGYDHTRVLTFTAG